MPLAAQLLLYAGLGLALANEAVWRLMSTDAWVNFKTFILPLALMGFMFTQFPMLQRHALPEDKD